MKKMLKTMLNRLIRYLTYLVIYILFRYIFSFRNKIKVIGKENTPKEHKNNLLCSIHISYLDSGPIIMSFIGIKEIFFKQKMIPYDLPDYLNFFGNKLGAFFMKHLKNIPTKRKTKDLEVREKVVQDVYEKLQFSNVLSFFEGGRGFGDGQIRPCITTVAEVILRHYENNKKLNVIPIFITGMDQIMPREIDQNYFKIKFGKEIVVIFGEPINFDVIINNNEISRKRKIRLIKNQVRDAAIALKPN